MGALNNRTLQHVIDTERKVARIRKMINDGEATGAGLHLEISTGHHKNGCAEPKVILELGCSTDTDAILYAILKGAEDLLMFWENAARAEFDELASRFRK